MSEHCIFFYGVEHCQFGWLLVFCVQSLCKEIVEERDKVSRLSAENIANRKLRWKYCETKWKYCTLRYTSVRWKETHNLKLKSKFSRLNNNNLNTKYSIELLLLNKTLLNIYYPSKNTTYLNLSSFRYVAILVQRT